MSSINNEKYASFKKRQGELVDLIERTTEVLSELEMEKSCEALTKAGKKINNDSFKIQVVGTFKNGKSTFINSFLGDEILPAYALPCTAVINEVKYAKEKKAVLHFKNPLPEKLPSEIPEKALAHMERHMMASVPPLRIDYDEIEDYVVIPIGKDPAEMLLESPYSKVELFWPLPLLENGVSIIDSPGLNEHATRTQVTMEYLVKADAILFVLNAQAICTRDEMRFIENNLKAQGFDDPFFIVNRFDCVTKESDRIGMKKFAKDKLGDFTTHEISFVSARNALDGKMDNDMEKLAGSGMVELEKTIADYLTKHKGKMKLAQPAKELKRIIMEEALLKVIPEQKEMLNMAVNDVKGRYETAKPKVEYITRMKEQLDSKMKLRIEQIKPDITRLIKKNYNDIEQAIPAWLDEYKPKTKPGLIPSKIKINAITKELCDYITERIDMNQAYWSNMTLVPFIKNSAAEVFEGMDEKLEEILSNVDGVRGLVSGRFVTSTTSRSAVERIKYDNRFSERTIVKSSKDFAENIGKNFAMTCLGSILMQAFTAVSPASIKGNLTGRVAGQTFSDDSSAVRKIKEVLAVEVMRGMEYAANETTNNIAESVMTRFYEVADSIVASLDEEIRECDNQISRIIGEMEKGRESVCAKEEELEKCADKLKRLNVEVDKLIFKLIEG